MYNIDGFMSLNLRHGGHNFPPISFIFVTKVCLMRQVQLCNIGTWISGILYHRATLDLLKYTFINLKVFSIRAISTKFPGREISDLFKILKVKFE